MYSITDEQVDFIHDDITRRGVITEDVRDNILDHVCCIIEYEMTTEKDFYEFYENTIARFYRKELREIEDETRDLITFKYYYAMKRTLKITGATSGLLILVGSVFKVLHLPGAGVALVLGLALFSLVFLPLNAVLKFRDEKGEKNRLLLSVGMLIMAVACIGILFKIMHWPFANILIQGSIIAFIVFYVPTYFFTRLRNPETKFNGSINTIFMIAVCGMLFALTNNKYSTHIADNLSDVDVYLDKQVDHLHIENAETVRLVNDAELIKLHKETETLYALIENTKANLIAKAEGISNQEALKFQGSLSNPFSNDIVLNHFVKAGGEFSYTSLSGAVDNYNNQTANYSIRALDIADLRLRESLLSILIHDLTQMQLQILIEESSAMAKHSH